MYAHNQKKQSWYAVKIKTPERDTNPVYLSAILIT